MEKNLYPNRSVTCIITRPIDLILNIINEYDKIYIYSPSHHQDLDQKLFKCFSNYIPMHIIPNILKEEDIDIVIGGDVI